MKEGGTETSEWLFAAAAFCAPNALLLLLLLILARRRRLLFVATELSLWRQISPIWSKLTELREKTAGFRLQQQQQQYK